MLEEGLQKKDNLQNTTTHLKKSRFILLIIMVVGLFLCSSINYMSLHNIDLAWNAERLSCEVGVDFVDNNGIVEQTPVEMYSRGFLFTFVYPVFQFLLFASILLILYR